MKIEKLKEALLKLDEDEYKLIKEYNDFSKRILTNPTENEKLYFTKLQIEINKVP